MEGQAIDTLTGGAGNDTFVFNAGISATTNVDTIVDFNVAQDTIRVDNAVMPGLGSYLRDAVLPRRSGSAPPALRMTAMTASSMKPTRVG